VNISPRKIETMEELNEMARLEAEIWEASPIPPHQTVTVAKNGGIIIGAFVDGKIATLFYL
jgi:predicted GNAT superfamily acetyltransferase